MREKEYVKLNGTYFQVLHDCAKARREVELHWRASNCRHIVQVKDVYENSYSGNKCLLVIMEWYVQENVIFFNVAWRHLLQAWFFRFIFNSSFFAVWKAESCFKGYKIGKMVLLLKEVYLQRSQSTKFLENYINFIVFLCRGCASDVRDLCRCKASTRHEHHSQRSKAWESFIFQTW